MSKYKTKNAKKVATTLKGNQLIRKIKIQFQIKQPWIMKCRMNQPSYKIKPRFIIKMIMIIQKLAAFDFINLKKYI